MSWENLSSTFYVTFRLQNAFSTDFCGSTVLQLRNHPRVSFTIPITVKVHDLTDFYSRLYVFHTAGRLTVILEERTGWCPR
jgi:hypothetical protein